MARIPFIVLDVRFPESTYKRLAPFTRQDVDKIVGKIRREAPEARPVGSWGIALSEPRLLEHYHPHDLDIFISQKHMKDAVRILQEMGFRPAKPGEIGHLLISPKDEPVRIFLLPRTIGTVNLLREKQGGIQAVELIPDTGVSLYTGIRPLPPGKRTAPEKIYVDREIDVFTHGPPETGPLIEHRFPGGGGTVKDTVGLKLLRFAPRDRRLLVALAAVSPKRFVSYVNAILRSVGEINPLQLYSSLGWLRALLKKSQVDTHVVAKVREAQKFLEGYMQRMGVDTRRMVVAGFYRVPVSRRGRILTPYVRVGLRESHAKYLREIR